MTSTTIAHPSATQRSFTGGGFLQPVPDIPPITCGGCARRLAPGTRTCPACGWERPGHQGEPYPAKSVDRYAWVLGQRIGDSTAKMVLVALVHHDMPGGQGVFPSVDRLVDMTDLDRASVFRALSRLRKAGWIVRHKVRRRGRQASNFYTVQQPELIVAENMLGEEGPPFPGSHNATLPESQSATLRGK